MFTSVPYKPRVQRVVLSAVGHQISQENADWYHKREEKLSDVTRNKQLVQISPVLTSFCLSDRRVKGGVCL